MVPCRWSKGVRGHDNPGSKAGTSLQSDMLVSSNSIAQNENFSSSFTLVSKKKG